MHCTLIQAKKDDILLKNVDVYIWIPVTAAASSFERAHWTACSNITRWYALLILTQVSPQVVNHFNHRRANWKIQTCTQ